MDRVEDVQLRLLLDNVQDTVFRLRLHPELELEYVSPSCETLTGYRPEEWHADPALPLRIVHPDDRHIVEEAFEGRRGGRDVTRWQRRDGTLVWVETERRVIADGEGRPVLLEGVARDVTARVLAEEEARRARALFEATFMQAPVGMGLTSLGAAGEHRLTEVNQALCDLLGRPREELLSRPLDDFTHPEDRQKSVPLKQAAARGDIPEFSMEKRFVRPDGTVVWVALRGTVVRDAEGRPLHGLGHVEDISERMAHEEGLRHRALHDALTDLPNRQLFLDRLEHALAQRPDGRRVGLLFADLDDLKTINDSFGHAAGDVVIRELGARFSATVRPGDSVARFAGDEITVLCPNLPDAEALERLGTRLLASLAEPVEFDEHAITITVSVGAATAAPGDRSADELLADADTALLEAKRQGKARVQVFDDSMQAARSERRTREAEVRAAATEGQFELHYQPIATLPDLRVRAVEALVRWRHPELGLLPPATFIEAAERLRVIDQIGRWVLDEACRDAVAWGEERTAARTRVSVNVSPHELISGRLADDVASALETNGCDGDALCLEITESGIIEDPAAAMRNLRSIKELGVKVALDDFGTGFSSLAHLAAFPVDVVKLDRVFVLGLVEGGDRSAALVRAVCSMAESLEIELVAEGIETRDQLERLIELGCHVGQGYLLGRPAPLAEVRAALCSDGDALLLCA